MSNVKSYLVSLNRRQFIVVGLALLSGFILFNQSSVFADIAVPSSENFDSFPLDNNDPVPLPVASEWENQTGENGGGDGRDWYVHTGGTGSTDTGPTGDHTTGSGNYLYVEDSNGNENNPVNLLSPIFDLAGTNAPEITFWHHSQVNAAGNPNTLHIDVLDSTNSVITTDVITAIQNNSAAWTERTIDMTPYIGSGRIRIRFRADMSNGGWHNDIAIDDFSVYDTITITPNQVDGTVFRDYDEDGVRDGDEPGVPNVTVSVYDASGNSASTTTDNLGAYVILNTDGAPGNLSGEVRVEFTLPTDGSLDFFEAGTAGGTTVQFVNITTGAQPVVGVNNPAQYSQPDPQVALARFEPGLYSDPGNAGVEAVNSHAYSANGTGQTLTPIALTSQVGTIYGMAYEATSGVLWGSAYIRRGASLGPTDSTGTIYQLTGTGAPSVFLDLQTMGFNTGANPHPNGSTPNWVTDPGGYSAVGKVGIGDIDISDDGQRMYAVNLNTRELIIMPITYDAARQPIAPIAANITADSNSSPDAM